MISFLVFRFYWLISQVDKGNVHFLFRVPIFLQQHAVQKNTCNVIQIEESYQKQLFAFTSITTFIGLLTIIGNVPVLETNRYNKRDYQLQTP